MSYKVLKEDGLYVVIDELKNVLHVCEKRSEATAMVRELNTAVKSNVKHVEGTYGTGVERVEEQVETATEQVETAVEQVETAKVEVATEQVVEEQIETAVEQVETVVEEQVTATEQVEVAATVAQQVVTVVAVEQFDATGKALKKSERVRIRIAIAKQRNETQEDVIKWTMADIGFARGLAKVYVQNNWHKV